MRATALVALLGVGDADEEALERLAALVGRRRAAVHLELEDTE